MDEIDRRLLDEFQRDFPLVPRPYAELARRLGTSETDVRERLEKWKERGAVSRIGAVFAPHKVGRSTLAALAVADGDVERVSAIVSAFPEVNHNYQREHAFNLWFVIAAEDEIAVDRVLAEIVAATGYRPLKLPMLEQFHIDLGFTLWN